MTLQQLNKLSKDEIAAREKKLGTFDATQSLEEYTEAIRDTIYLWKFIDNSRKSYTFDYVKKLVTNKAIQIKAFYEEKEPAAYAAIDIDYCCG